MPLYNPGTEQDMLDRLPYLEAIKMYLEAHTTGLTIALAGVESIYSSEWDLGVKVEGSNGYLVIWLDKDWDLAINADIDDEYETHYRELAAPESVKFILDLIGKLRP